MNQPRPNLDRLTGLRAVAEAARTLLQDQGYLFVRGERDAELDLVLAWLHAEVRSADAPLIRVNCTALASEAAIGEALFGVALRGELSRRGALQVATLGTVVLEGVAELTPMLQARVVQYLAERRFLQMGSAQPSSADALLIVVDGRAIAPPHGGGALSSELYYRLLRAAVNVPPLQERPEDRDVWIRTNLNLHPLGSLDADEPSLEALRSYPWPGGLRELEFEIERAANQLSSDEFIIRMQNLSERLRADAKGPAAQDLRDAVEAESPLTLRQAVEIVERKVISEGLLRVSGNRSRLAKQLGISRSSLIEKIKTYEL